MAVDVEIRGKQSVDKAAREAGQALKGLGDDAKKAGDALNTGLSMAGPIAAALAIVGTIKKVTETVGECVNAFREEDKAAAQFGASMRQSGLITAEGAARIDEYTKALARQTGERDSTIKGYAAMLANAGRTEDQIKRIMTAAADFSVGSGKGMSESIQQLNKSFGGLAGELGETIPQIKNLTAEQLKAGGAVDFIAEKYKGLAGKVSETDVSIKNFDNALNTLKSGIGEKISSGFNPLRDWVTSIIDKWNSAAKAVKDYKTAQDSLDNKKGATASRSSQLVVLQDQLQATISARDMLTQGGTITSSGGAFFDNLTRINKEMEGLYKQIGETKRAIANEAKPVAPPAPPAGGGGGETSSSSGLNFTAEGRRYRQSNYNPNALVAPIVNASAESMANAVANRTWDDVRLARERAGVGGQEISNVSYDQVAQARAFAASLVTPSRDSARDDRAEMRAAKKDAIENTRSFNDTRANPFDKLLEAVGPIANQFIGLLVSLTNVQALLNPVMVILKSMFDVIGPLINTALAPLVGILKIIGGALGQILTPIIVGLGEVIKYIMTGILEIYNGIADAINWALGWAGVKLDHADLASATAAGMADTTYASGSSSSGANASYTRPRDITLSATLYTNVVWGPGGIREAAEEFRREFQSMGVLGLS